jgi:hypothetical protein
VLMDFVGQHFQPIQVCLECGDKEVVRPDGRGFPPDIAKRRLAKRCRAAGHVCDPQYRAGFHVGEWPQGMAKP